MNELFKLNAARISSCYSNLDLIKGEEDELEKGGRGSGRKATGDDIQTEYGTSPKKQVSTEDLSPKKSNAIGKTQSGKNIYDRFDHESHSNFSNQDHEDAEVVHGKITTKQPHNTEGEKLRKYHIKQAHEHRDASQTIR